MAQKPSTGKEQTGSKKPTKPLEVKKTPLRDLQVKAKSPAVKGGTRSRYAPPYVPV